MKNILKIIIGISLVTVSLSANKIMTQETIIGAEKTVKDTYLGHHELMKPNLKNSDGCKFSIHFRNDGSITHVSYTEECVKGDGASYKNTITAKIGRYGLKISNNKRNKTK